MLSALAVRSPQIRRTVGFDLWSVSGGPVLLLLVVALAANVARALPVLALLPATGDGPREQRLKLDTAIRKAAGADGGYTLLTAAEIEDQITYMAEQGTICTSTDISCLRHLGILCGAGFLLVPDAQGTGELQVSLVLLGVEDSVGVVRKVEGAINLATGSVKALTQRALRGGDDPNAAAGELGGRDPRPDDLALKKSNLNAFDETRLNDLQFTGAAVASVGSILGALSLLGALGCEAIFWTGTGSADARKDVVAPLGAVLWVATMVGGAAAATGGGILLAGAPAPGAGELAAVK